MRLQRFNEESREAESSETFLASPQVLVEHLTPEYFEDALSLYEERTDKQWGMVDCFSFVIMRKLKLKACLGTDHHFVQAGFKNLPF